MRGIITIGTGRNREESGGGRSRNMLIGMVLLLLLLAGSAELFAQERGGGVGTSEKRAEEPVKVVSATVLDEKKEGEGDNLIDRPKVGFGFTAGAGSLGGELVGGHLLFSVERNIHVGAQIGLSLTNQSGNSARRATRPVFNWSFSPYTKVFLPVRGSINPFFIGQLVVQKSGLAYEIPDEEFGVSYDFESTSSISTSLYFGGGAEYFVSKSFGLFGYVGLLDIDLDNGSRQIGILGPRVGIEWLF